MVGHCLLTLLLVSSGATATPALSYKGGIRLPVALSTSEGTHLEKGRYDAEVKVEAGRYDLVFLQNDHPVATVKGEVLKEDANPPAIEMPLIGTQYLRSSADPVGTEAERHWSK